MRVAVFTVTGDQGSSVSKSLIEGGHEVLGITRNPSSEMSKDLAKLGITLIKGDLSDPASYSNQLENIDAAFVNADFWVHYLSNGYNAVKAQEAEVEQSIGAIEASVKAGAKHIVYSTLDEVENGACPHFESKNTVSRYLKQHGIPHTNLVTCNYFSNLTKFGMLKPTEEKSKWLLAFGVPDDTVISSFPVEQTGLWVKEALYNPDKWIGKDMYATTDSLSISQMADTLARVGKVTVETLQLTRDDFYSDKHKQQTGEELWLAMKLIYEGKTPRTPETTTVIPGTWNFETWVKGNPQLKEWFNNKSV
ncbi:uncharacterized protein IL334_006909 [Kwoniella shivajii]|uniref:NmrA-like domain-containing protein n=1 Tax=Kwoniella shivajii TaxID=564305 RepID=A0ABZ1D7Q5_9TREE|nr:hypothetical protein IL334_006909 [Kwoniella shivajii]